MLSAGRGALVAEYYYVKACDRTPQQQMHNREKPGQGVAGSTVTTSPPPPSHNDNKEEVATHHSKVSRC